MLNSFQKYCLSTLRNALTNDIFDFVIPCDRYTEFSGKWLDHKKPEHVIQLDKDFSKYLPIDAIDSFTGSLSLKQDMKRLTRCLKRGIEVNALYKSEYSPLMLACRGLTLLSSRIDGIDGPQVNEEFYIPPNMQLIELLLESGADLNLRTSKGNTALSLAERSGRFSVSHYTQLDKQFINKLLSDSGSKIVIADQICTSYEEAIETYDFSQNEYYTGWIEFSIVNTAVIDLLKSKQ